MWIPEWEGGLLDARRDALPKFVCRAWQRAARRQVRERWQAWIQDAFPLLPSPVIGTLVDMICGEVPRMQPADEWRDFHLLYRGEARRRE